MPSHQKQEESWDQRSRLVAPARGYHVSQRDLITVFRRIHATAVGSMVAWRVGHATKKDSIVFQEGPAMMTVDIEIFYYHIKIYRISNN
jgi:hypothetical protein